MKQNQDGSYVVSSDEMKLLRQGLFVAVHHGDSVFRGSETTITGYELDDFQALMWAIDELSGHNREARRLLASQLETLAALNSQELENRLGLLDDIVCSADRFSVEVPAKLRQALRPQA